MTTVWEILSVQVPFVTTKVIVFVPVLVYVCVAFAPVPLAVPSPHSQVYPVIAVPPFAEDVLVKETLPEQGVVTSVKLGVGPGNTLYVNVYAELVAHVLRVTFNVYIPATLAFIEYVFAVGGEFPEGGTHEYVSKPVGPSNSKGKVPQVGTFVVLVVGHSASI